MNNPSQAILTICKEAVENMKGVDPVVLDIDKISSIADAMLIVTGTSQRHVNSMAEEVRVKAKEAGYNPLGVEGTDSSDWILVDLGDVIVHVMTEETRDFYALEKLWTMGEVGKTPANSAHEAR